MLPVKYGAGSSSALRKSRLEGKPSMLPKPRRPSSTDRQSTEYLRPSTAGYRSSSAEPSRGTFAAGRLSREASATKLSYNRRSRSQTGDARYGQATAYTTPLRNPYPRPTTTPVKTPDHSTRTWQAMLDRALGFVTVKDQRPISNVAWQRSETARVSELLKARGEGDAMALIRPLTIARFVEITGALLTSITKDAKLNNDNYVTKLPHLCKRLLYPGALSKSWLRTVNTLHAFPHALALIAYLLDMLAHMEAPVEDEEMYIAKDELACLRRQFLYKCWIRFQGPEPQFEDLEREHVQNLKMLLGDDEEKVADLQQVIKQLKNSLEDEVELSARAEEARLRERHEALAAALREMRAARRAAAADAAARRAGRTDCARRLHALDGDIERASAELERLRAEVGLQPLSVAERTRLLDQVDYMTRVHDSKASLADQIAKMVLSKESELALWQKRTLDACVEYKQGLIHLTAHCPALAALAIDEKELMEPECGARVARAVEVLRAQAGELAARRAETARTRTALCRRRAAQLEEARARVAELKASVSREQEALDAELAREAAAAAAAAQEDREVNGKLEALRARQEEYARVDADLAFAEKQDLTWRTKLAELREHVASQRAEAQRLVGEARARRVRLLAGTVRLWAASLGQ